MVNRIALDSVDGVIFLTKQRIGDLEMELELRKYILVLLKEKKEREDGDIDDEPDNKSNAEEA